MSMEKKRIWELGRDSVETYRGKKKLPLVLVVDNVRSLNNIGAMFRTADAFLVEQMVLCGISSPPPSPEIHKTALGAEDTVAWRYYPDTLEAIETLRADGYKICCLEQVKGSIELQKFKVSDAGKYAIVVGNEVDGVDQRVVDASDVALEIPQHGTKHSLNVSVSAALSLWHFFLQLT